MMMGYKVGSTHGGLATIQERTKRLGQAMDGNTMRWLGAFLYANHTVKVKEDIPEGTYLGPGFTKWHNRIENYFSKDDFFFTDPHHQACAVVEKLIACETPSPNKQMGGVTQQIPKDENSC